VGVGAGLEVDVERAAFGAVGGLGERLLLGMRLTRGSVVALARQVTLAIEHHGADHRVRARAEVGLQRKLESTGRPVKVGAAIAQQGMWLSCHCNNRIRSMRFSSLLSCSGSNCCSL
jgi:hypothetical protein